MKVVRKGGEELGWVGGSRNTLGCSSNYFRVFIDLNLYFLPALVIIYNINKYAYILVRR